MHSVVLADATSRGCRAGSLLDPGPYDAALADEPAAILAEMQQVRRAADPVDTKLDRPQVRRAGAPPARVFVGQASWTLDPGLGATPLPTSMSSTRAFRLEWQREAAP